MNRPTIYFVDINDPDETGTYESNYRHTVLAADYDALLARAKTAEADFLAAAECNVEQRKTIQRFQTELATERLRADAAVGDANAAERRAAELERWIRRIDRRNDDPKRFDPEMNLMIRQALAGQQKQGKQEWPKEQCPVTGAIRDVDPADLAEQPAAADERESFEAEWATISANLPSHQRSSYSAIDLEEAEKYAALVAWQAHAALAPAAVVVMPERMTTIPEGKTISYAAGYEDALNKVARLNRNTVSLELLEQAIRCLDEKLNKHETHATKYATADQLRAILGANCGSIDDLTHDSDCSTNNHGCPDLIGPCDCSLSEGARK